MMRDINDQGWRADLLGDVLTSYGDWGWVHVNLIPLNPTPGSKWTASRPEDEREFVRRLEAKGVPTTVRDTRGSEIDGACGQLRRSRRLGLLGPTRVAGTSRCLSRFAANRSPVRIITALITRVTAGRAARASGSSTCRVRLIRAGCRRRPR